jgi:hypothetical protein
MTRKPRRLNSDGLIERNWYAPHDPSAPLWAEPAQLADGLHIPLYTIWSWVRRNQVASACCLRTGRLMVDAREVGRRRTRQKLDYEKEQAMAVTESRGAA